MRVLRRRLLGALICLGVATPAASASDRLGLCERGPQAQVLAADRLQAGPAATVLVAPGRFRWAGLQALPSSARIELVSGQAGTLARDSLGRLVGAEQRWSLRPEASSPQDLQLLQDPGPEQWRLLAQSQLAMVVLAPDDRILLSSSIQMGTLLDLAFADQARHQTLGYHPSKARWSIWAPSAKAVNLCRQQGGGWSLTPAVRDESSGVWSVEHAAEQASIAIAQVEVFVPGVGLVLNQVTDPYAHALTGNSRHFALVRLDDPRATPRGWQQSLRKTQRILANHDLVIYELHVRDFSWADSTVPSADRGRYRAFTHLRSRGMQHLARLARAGLTDVHLLPVFDIATVDEKACNPKSMSRADDCFNWGYDPYHFNAPEGVYASQPDDPLVRIREFREMVMALRRIGLRVGMDVVYNHTARSGQDLKSVLDRVVPGYYHRLSPQGAMEQSTCCENTATERVMMDKLMRDSLVLWATAYGIESFRFDLMGHQPRQAMVQAQIELNRRLGRPINLLGEGWNFGEVADGRLFPQASQLSLYGTGIGTFSDRSRDAIRGGSAGDRGADLAKRGGLIHGVITPEAMNLVRLALVGNLREIEIQTQMGSTRSGQALPYAGQPAGYAASADEVVHYVENHDNHTLFDLNVLRAPRHWDADRLARAQLLALSTTALAQGIAYFHAGVDILRSKSMDRNSYDSGDAVNQIDWSLQDNGFGASTPPREDHEQEWSLMQERLQDRARVKPSPKQIQWVHQGLLNLLQIRRSSPLFSLGSQAEIQSRVEWLKGELGHGLIGLRLHARPSDGPGVKSVVLAINFGEQDARLSVPLRGGERLALHPVHRSPQAADRRPMSSHWSRRGQMLTVPALTAVVWEVQT
ncbi:MAG: hypothetical protein RLY30_1117 [Pseudomonadota bacterium]